MTTSNEKLTDSLLRWLANRHTGLSSKVMAFCALGIPSECIDHPYDPADFNWCLLLLAQVPKVRESFSRIAKLSPQWAIIIDHWEELEEMFVDEVGLNWSKAHAAPAIYRRMCELLSTTKGR